jgi:hypothetical protein
VNLALTIFVRAAIGVVLLTVGVMSLRHGGATMDGLAVLPLLLGAWELVKCGGIFWYGVVHPDRLG